MTTLITAAKETSQMPVLRNIFRLLLSCLGINMSTRFVTLYLMMTFLPDLG